MRGRKFTLAKLALGGGALIALLVATACGSRVGSNAPEAGGIVIVNAPQAGEVRRVLVSEGMMVNAGTPVIEIAVRTETPPGTPTPQAEDPRARAGRTIAAAQSEIEAARADAVRADVEVQRLAPLVAAGDVPQAQLDGARAESERAQRRLQQAQSSAQSAQSGLVTVERQQQQTPNAAPAVATTTAAPSERLVMAATTSAGTVSVVSARVGDRVIKGQPLATLRAGAR